VAPVLLTFMKVIDRRVHRLYRLTNRRWTNTVCCIHHRFLVYPSLWRPPLPYGYIYKAYSARPG